ncbi:hypothetical protein ACTFIY_010726 [Dictyostelium cf. discoideum]
MNKKVILATFLFLTSFLKVFCKIDIDDAIVISNETYLSYQLPLGSENITSITFEHYDGSQFQLNLECSNSKNSNSTTCFTTINDEDKKQMYGSIISYNDRRTMNRDMFPTPIISSPFRPPTKGGELVIKGTYLAFFERSSFYQIIYPTRQFIDILNPRLSFDPTNINVQFPPGCGYQLIKWENNKLYNFSYENPSISNIKTTYSNIIVNGSNFCDKSYPSNITIDGNLIQSPNYEKDQDSIIIKYNEKYSTKSKIIIETSNCTSIETIFEFKPDHLTINSVPTNKGGLILINGIRLSPNPTNKNKNNITIKIGNLTCLNVISVSSELISCTLSPLNKFVSNNNKNDLPVSVSINEITNENTLIFNYNIVRLNPIKYSLPNRVLQLNGDCLGNLNNTTVYLNGKLVILKDLEINYNETVLTFKIPDEYQSKLNVSVKVNNIMSNEIQIDISFYVSFSNLSPSTNENTNIILTLYNIKPENYNKLPTLIINSEDQIPINGVSLNSTNQEVNSYSFLIPVGCGKKEITIKIGTQSCLSSISYIEPIISNCKVSGYDGKSGEVICVGDFGNENYFSQSYVLFSNNKISLTLINRTTLSFPFLSDYHSDDLIFEMCEIQSNPFKLSINISPSLKRIDSSNVNRNGGLFYIFGEFFNSNINSSVFCDDIQYQGVFENTTTISFDLPIQGPNDIMCNYSFNNGMNHGDFKIEYPRPTVENISTISTIGGVLTIYGNNFYNISNITIEVNNQLQCNNIEFINLTTITCSLPPINETIQSSIFNQKILINITTVTFSEKLLLKITFESKTWSGYIFQYYKDEIQNNNSKNSSYDKYNIKEQNNENGINLNTIVISNETYLSYQLPLGSENITSITFEHYDSSQFQLNLECSNSKNSNSTTCFTTINDEDKKQMYGSIISYNDGRTMNRAMFPTPIISSPFIPPTKGDAIVISNETYLSYQLPLGSENITTITFEHYDGSQFQLNLECSNSKNSNSTTCFTTINDEEKKQMYGSRISINHEPSTNWAMFPTPIISSPFRPLTKGELVIKGTYLAFSERIYYQIIYPTRQFIDILNPRLSFDPTNLNVQFPPGCGYQLIKWENNKLYNFSYGNPSISNIKTTYSNIIVNGSNFCDKSYPSNITIDGNLIQSPNYEKDQDSIIIKYNEKYSTKSKIIIETSNCTSIETIFEFKPDQLTINSVPTNKGGLILINGIRLSPNPTNKNKNNITIKIGNLTCLNVISISSELISCTLSPLDKSVSNNIKNDLQVSVSINEITNENTLIFNYNIVKLNPIKYSLPNRVLQLNGDCLGSISNTTVYLNGKQVILKDLEINHNETVLTFKIPDEYQSKLNVSVKVNDVMSNEIQIDISFYVSLSNLSPSTNENTNIILTLYNIKPENYNKLPTLIINSEDQIPINGVSLNSTNQEVNSYSFLIPVGCGKKEITIKIGTQSCLSSISYIEPIISNCKVSGYDGKSGEVICVGDFGNENYFSQSYVLFSNNKISLTLINRTTLSFPFLFDYHSDDLIFEMCEIQSSSFKLSINISPSLKRIDASNVNTNGGLFYIFGEFFNSNINSTVFCDDNPYQGTFENTTTISFDLPIQGPNDIKCNYSFNNGMNHGDFQVEYPKPIVENISTIYVTGGNLTIYGNNFYNISNITIEVNNQLQCNNIEFINLRTITCNLPPINETIQSSIFNQKILINTTTTIFSEKLLLKITFDSKT